MVCDFVKVCFKFESFHKIFSFSLDGTLDLVLSVSVIIYKCKYQHSQYQYYLFVRADKKYELCWIPHLQPPKKILLIIFVAADCRNNASLYKHISFFNIVKSILKQGA